MLKKFTSLLFLTFFLFGTKNSSKAQTPQHFIQTLSGANSFPLNSTTSNRCQFLILASELSGVLQAGAISKIYITPSSSVASSTFTNFTVKIGMTTLTDLGTGTQPYITAVTTAVSAPTITFTGAVANQWLEIPLDNPILYDGTSNLIIELSQTAYTSGLSLRINTGILGRRLYGLVSGTTGTANSGRLDFGMDLSPIGPNNAGLTTLTSPVSFCPGTHPIKVKVKNSGTNIIDSVKVAWSLDGVAQPTYSLNLPLDTLNGTGLIEREVTLGTHTFTTAPVAFKAWTFLPNNMPDTFNLNDTLSQTLQSSLSGTYTINSALPTGGINYQTFAAFTSALNTYGVCGPVIANVSGGPFVEKVDFGNIAGTSAANYIRVKGNGATVQFTNTITDRQLLTLNGTKYLTIDSLTFKSLATDYGWAALITNGSAHDSIINCFFDMTSVTSISSANTNGITFSGSNTAATTAGSNGSNCYIGNNYVKFTDGTGGGYYAISLAGVNDSNVIENNTIENFYYYGAYVNGASNLILKNNNFHKQNKTASITTFYGIYTTGVTPGMQLIGNRIHHPGGALGGSGTFYGINSLGDGTIASPVLIANNAIYGINLNGGLNGIYLSTSPYNYVYHNTVVFDQALSNTGTTYGIYATGTNTNTEIKNNNVSITAGTAGIKYGFYYSTTASVADVQKNNIYLNSTQAGVQNYGYYAIAYLTQAAFQTAYPALELGSPSVDPLFVSASTGNLTPANAALIGAGANLLSLVPKDILGVTRAAAPTIGAFEVPPVVSGINNAALLSVAPIAGPLCVGNQTLKVIISNAGSNNINPTVLNWTLNGVAQTPVTSTATLVPASSAGQHNDTLTLSNVFVNNTATIKFWITTVNGILDTDHSNDTLTTSVTVNAIPVVNLGNDTAICAGQTLTLNVGTANSAYSKLWSNAATTQTIPVNTAGSYSVIVSNNGCAKSDTIVVSVLASPIVNLGNDTTICIGSSLTLNAGAANSANSKLWSNAATTQSINVSTAGTYSVTVSNGTCSKSDTIVVGIKAIPVVNLGADTAICAGSTLTLNAGAANSTFTKLWSTGASTQSINVTAAGNYNVTVSNGGCSKKDTIIVTSLPSPVVNLGNDTAICAGTTLTLNAGSGTGNTYAWSTGAATQTISVNTAGTYMVTVSNGSCQKKDTQIVSISPVPTLNLMDTVAICSGTSTTLDAGNAGATFLWNNGTTNQTLTTQTAGNKIVKVTNSFNCVKRDTTFVVINPLPIVHLGNDTMICVGAQLILNAQNVGSNYLWNTAATTQTIMVNTAGTYNVTVTSPKGCIGKDTIMINTFAPISVDGFNFIPRFDVQQGRVDFTPINPVQVDSYLWNFGDGTTSTLQNPSHVYSTSANYDVKLTVSNACGSTDTSLLIYVDLQLGVRFANSADIKIDVYPVPAQESLTIECLASEVKLKSISIYNTIGQEVILKQNINNSKTTINTDNLTTGNYFIKIETNKGTAFRRVNILK